MHHCLPTWRRHWQPGACDTIRLDVFQSCQARSQSVCAVLFRCRVMHLHAALSIGVDQLLAMPGSVVPQAGAGLLLENAEP